MNRERIIAEAIVNASRVTRQGAAARYMDGMFRFGGKRVPGARRRVEPPGIWMRGMKNLKERGFHGSQR